MTDTLRRLTTGAAGRPRPPPAMQLPPPPAVHPQSPVSLSSSSSSSLSEAMQSPHEATTVPEGSTPTRSGHAFESSSSPVAGTTESSFSSSQSIQPDDVEDEQAESDWSSEESNDSRWPDDMEPDKLTVSYGYISDSDEEPAE